MTSTGASAQDPVGVYFFLSYAHLPPISGPVGPAGNTDYWVQTFFGDLRDEVARLARADGGRAGSRYASMSFGFYDALLPPGSDWRLQLAGALGVAEVFVPLYSPGYVNRTWPRGERESFRRRAEAAGGTIREHIQPVLWTPIQDWGDDHPDEEPALMLGMDVPAYRENGMRAMRMLADYRPQYRLVLHRLAARIVDVVERSPLGPSPAPAVVDVPGSDTVETSFVVATLAPTIDAVPEGRRPDTYGPRSVQWQPFGNSAGLPVADYAVNVAERLGLPTQIVDFADIESRLKGNPGLLLIDPWVIAHQPTSLLPAAVGDLPQWVTPVVIVDENDSQYATGGAVLGTRFAGMLHAAGLRHTRTVASVAELEYLMPSLVSQARRRFLRFGPSLAPKGAASERRRLADGDTSAVPRQRNENDG
jgi:FxsC-like protein